MTTDEIRELTLYAAQRRDWRFDRARRVKVLLGKLLADRDRILAELAEWLDMAMRSEAIFEPTGPRGGWWDSGAVSSVCEIGDRLVELGKWERHPDGHGRRWWYRPVKQ